MNVLLDTHLLLNAAGAPEKLSAGARRLFRDRENTLHFSAASIWEVAIKRGLGRDDFEVDPRLLRVSLLENGYREIAIDGRHALALDQLPSIHRDPFDRILVAQAIVEGMTLATADERLSKYPGPIRKV